MIVWNSLWIGEMVRVTKPTGSIFLHNFPKWLTYYAAYLNRIAYFKHWIAWDAPTSPMGKSLQPSHYGILFYAKDPARLNFFEIRYPHKRNRTDRYLQKDYGGKKDLLHPSTSNGNNHHKMERLFEEKESYRAQTDALPKTKRKRQK